MRPENLLHIYENLGINVYASLRYNLVIPIDVTFYYESPGAGSDGIYPPNLIMSIKVIPKSF